MKYTDVFCELGCVNENVVEVNQGILDTFAGCSQVDIGTMIGVMGENDRAECAPTNER